MCIHCRREDDYYLADALFGGFGGRRGRGMDFFGDPFGFDDGINRNSFAPVSQRARGALENAKQIFLNHLASVDVSNGSVSHEIITFHLVPDMRKQFSKFVKEYGCTAASRQLTRAEQDLINKTRKSLMFYTSVTVSDAAQRAYLEKHPHLRKPAATGQTSSSSDAGHASSSSSRPLQDASERKIQRQLNEAAVTQAASNSTVKRLRKKA